MEKRCDGDEFYFIFGIFLPLLAEALLEAKWWRSSKYSEKTTGRVTFVHCKLDLLACPEQDLNLIFAIVRHSKQYVRNALDIRPPGPEAPVCISYIDRRTV